MLGVVTTAAWVVAGLANAASDDALTLEVHQFSLPNGMEVRVHRDARAPLVATAMRVEMGTADEAGGQAGPSGVAHLVEHLMFTGSPRVPSGAHDRWLEAAGGESNAWTDHDATVYTTVAPANALDLILALEADRLAGFAEALAEPAIRIQRDVVLEERAEQDAVQGGMDMACWQAALFPDAHPYHWPVLGTVADLELLDLSDVQEFVEGRLLPARVRLIIVGDVDPGTVETQVRRWFGNIPSGTPVPGPVPVAVTLGEEVRWLRIDSSPQLTALWPTVPNGHPDAPALDLVARLLASAGVGVLWTDLVERGPKVEGVRVWQWNGRLAGYMGIAVHTGSADMVEVLERLDRRLERLRRKPPDRAVLARLVERWRATWIRQLEDPVRRANILAECACTGCPEGCVATRIESLRSVTPADISRVIDRWLIGPGRAIVSSVPIDEMDRALPDSSPLVIP